MDLRPSPVLHRRLEAVAIIALAILGYGLIGGSWPLFAALFFVPDLSIAAYAAGPRIGGLTYNAAHFFGGPVIVGAWVLLGDAPPLAAPIALIWTAHIAFDRALGWGLKFEESFMHTDMGTKTLPMRVPMLEAKAR